MDKTQRVDSAGLKSSQSLPPTPPPLHGRTALFRHSFHYCEENGFVCFKFQGMSVAILGPTFQDLAENVNRNISNLSLIFVGRATGFLCGTTIGGILFDHMNQFFLLGE